MLGCPTVTRGRPTSRIIYSATHHGNTNRQCSFFFCAYMAQDFKPANCMLCSNGLIKITDFGA